MNRAIQEAEQEYLEAEKEAWKHRYFVKDGKWAHSAFQVADTDFLEMLLLRLRSLRQEQARQHQAPAKARRCRSSIRAHLVR